MSGRRLVIVADDDDDIRECIADILSDEGFDVRMARNGRAALDLLDVLGDERCVLLLDLMMPILSGFEVLRLLARAGRLPALPVVVCSAMRSTDPLPPGVRRVVHKPLDLGKLLGAVVEACSEPAGDAASRVLTENANDPEASPARRAVSS